MNKTQAFNLLDNVLSKLQISRQDHVNLQEALKILIQQELLSEPETEKETKKDEKHN